MDTPKQTNEAADGQSQLTAELAAKIAREIFDCGDESPQFGGKAQRLQFMGGTYPGNEVAMGGLNEFALTAVIRRALVANAPELTRAEGVGVE